MIQENIPSLRSSRSRCFMYQIGTGTISTWCLSPPARMTRRFSLSFRSFVPTISPRGALIVCRGLSSGSGSSRGCIPHSRRLSRCCTRCFAALVTWSFVPSVIGWCTLSNYRYISLLVPKYNNTKKGVEYFNIHMKQ